MEYSYLYPTLKGWSTGGFLTGKHELQSFIGVVNFHRDHISLFAKVAKPLYNMMGPTPTFVWDQQLRLCLCLCFSSYI